MKTFLRYFSLIVYLAAIILSVFPTKSLANTETYRPPKGKIRQQARKAGGSRGCNLPLNDAVTLLVPQDHTPTTISAHPTFFWYLSQKLSLPLRFTLLEPGKKPILAKELTPKPGIIALKLPQTSPGLKIGKTYRWTVTIVCNPKQPSSNLFAQAWIERVSLPSSNKFSEYTNHSVFCTTKYAKAGIWYDALACDYSKLNENESNRDLQEFWSLLEEIDLPYLAQRKPTLSLY